LTGETSARWHEVIARVQLDLMEWRLPDSQTDLQQRIAAGHAWQLNRDTWFTSSYLYAEAFRCLF